MKLLALLVAMLVPSMAWGEAWVMVIPPVDDQLNPTKILVVPLDMWKQHVAFDSAKECEAYKIDMRKIEEGRARSKASIEQVASALCIPYEFWWRAQQPGPR